MRMILGALTAVLLAGAAAAADMKPADVIKEWPETSRNTAQAMLDKYGEPEVVTSDFIKWKGNGAWKKTMVFKEETAHNFPKEHSDVIRQTINYRVPVDRVDDLAAFDGSLTYDRTRGELSSSCASEPANFLALNLANDIVQGKLSVEAARSQLAETIASSEAGKESDLTQKLMFTVANDGTADPDEAALKEEGMPKQQ